LLPARKSNELRVHTCSYLYGLPALGLYFFTVYGPEDAQWTILFAKAILAGKPIKMFNHGRMQRDSLVLLDIVEGVLRRCDKLATANPCLDPLASDPAMAAAPHSVFNIRISEPIELFRFIEVMEKAFGRDAIRDFHSMQLGDVVETVADTSAIESWL